MSARPTSDDQPQAPEMQPRRPAFADPRSLSSIRQALHIRLQDAIVSHGDDHCIGETMTEIEHLARGIVIDMLATNEFRALVMQIAWPKIDADGVRLRTLHAMVKTLQEYWIDSDVFEQKIRHIVDERMTSNLKETIRLRCDHKWVDDLSKLMQGGKYCPRCKATKDRNGNVFHQPPAGVSRDVP